MICLTYVKVFWAIGIGASLVGSRRISNDARRKGASIGPGGINKPERGDIFVCPRECTQCCMSPKSGFHFECYFKPLFVERADIFKELRGYMCNRSSDMKSARAVFTECALGDDS